MSDLESAEHELIPLRSEERKRLLPLGVTKLYEEINSGRLPAVKVGSRTYLRRGDLHRYVEGLPRIGRGAT